MKTQRCNIGVQQLTILTDGFGWESFINKCICPLSTSMGFIKEKCLVFSKITLGKLSVVISNFPIMDREVTLAT